MNRTVTWGFRYDHGDVFTAPYNEGGDLAASSDHRHSLFLTIDCMYSLVDELSGFLNDPNLIDFFVNQHHNITNPKVISFSCHNLT